MRAKPGAHAHTLNYRKLDHGRIHFLPRTIAQADDAAVD